MYIYKRDGNAAEFWFDDVDEWELAYSIQEIAEGEGVGLAVTVDHLDDFKDYDVPYEKPPDGRWCLLFYEVNDIDRIQAIARAEWAEYEAWLIEAAS